MRPFITLIIAQIMGGISFGVSFSMGALLAAHLGGTAYGSAGATLTTIGAALFAIPLAKVVTNNGRRPAMTSGMSIGFGGTLLAFTAALLESLPLLLAGFLLIGAASAVNLQARFAAADYSDPIHRGRNLSLAVWATIIGAAAGPNLITVAKTVGQWFGVDQYAGAYIICMTAQIIAIIVLRLGLPAPEPVTAATHTTNRSTIGKCAGIVILGLACAHFGMVALMSMTPVHMHSHGSSLQLVGLTISLHVAGMYALAPVFGWLSDRLGRGSALAVGYAMLLVSCVVLITVADNHSAVMIALILLGLGWSGAFVASSALLIDAVTVNQRPTAQGRSDFTMNIAGALGGLLAGPVIQAWGMPTLAAAVGAITVIVFLVVWRGLATTAMADAQQTKDL